MKNLKPSRKILGSATMLVAAGMMYGSWAPFALQSANVSDVLTTYWGASWSSSRSDTAANVALTVPFSFLLTAFFHSFRMSLWWQFASVGVVILFSALLSFILEFVQGWFQHRVPSIADTMAQVIGAIFGCICGWTLGPPLARALDEFISAPRRSRRVQAAATVAAMLALLWSVLPGQILVSPADYARKWARGQIELVPFTLLDPWSAEAVFQAGWNIVLGVPLGFWAFHTLVIYWRRNPPLATQFLLLFGLGVLPEFMQLFVAKRFSSATDAIFVTVGAAGGLYTARYGWGTSGDREVSRRWRDPAVWFALSVGYLLLLCFIAWYPFDFVTEPNELTRRGRAITDQPFSDYRGSNFRLFFEALRAVALGGIFGGLLGIAVGWIPHRKLRKAALAGLFPAAFLISLGIELGQLLESSRTAGAMGALSRTLGMWLGLAAGLKLVGRSEKATTVGT